MRLLETVRRHFRNALAGLTNETDELLQRITATRDSQFGDYQANLSLAMMLGKKLGREPVEVASQIAERLKEIAAAGSHSHVRSHSFFASVDVAGRGFINMRLNDAWIVEETMMAESAVALGVTRPEEPKTYIVDFSSPNVAKPMHVGHIRSTVIGDAIVRTLRKLGHKVISDNHLGDWGTQFGMVIYGYKNFNDAQVFQENPLAELSRQYRLVQQIIAYQSAKASLEPARKDRELMQQRVVATQIAMQLAESQKNPDEKKLAKQLKAAQRGLQEADDAIEELEGKIAAVEQDALLMSIASRHSELDSRVQSETAKLHSGDVENLRLWHEFLPHCKAEIQHIYDRLGIQFDYELGESFYHTMLGPTVESLLQRGLAVESQGAICVFLEGFDAPMIIRKQDGAYLYATTDLATVDYRMKHFAPDAILYVVDHRQSDHFQKLFRCLEQTGISRVELRHISFGTVLGKDGRPFKTRSGSVVGLESLLDEAVSRALQVVCDPGRLQKASLDLTDEEKQHVASVVGIGAIKYADLSHHRENDYEFDLDKMVQLEGNTAAYIQYSYARTQNILRKLAESKSTATDQTGAVDKTQIRPSPPGPGLMKIEPEALADNGMNADKPGIAVSASASGSKEDQFSSGHPTPFSPKPLTLEFGSRGGDWHGFDAKAIAFDHPLERSLAVQLLRFEDALHSSMVDYLPSVLTEYLYELAKLFASFFDQCPVLRAETASQQQTRRLLVSLTGKTLKEGLGLLNIQTVDRM